jgi:hypothetical protein
MKERDNDGLNKRRPARTPLSNISPNGTQEMFDNSRACFTAQKLSDAKRLLKSALNKRWAKVDPAEAGRPPLFALYAITRQAYS